MKLTLIETKEAYLVVFDNNPDDWVARFSKSQGFPAREWAERMVMLYNYGVPRAKEEGCEEK